MAERDPRVSLTAIIWVTLGVRLLVMSVRRPVWAVALYLMTFFALPQLWWWGDELPICATPLWSGYVLLGAVILAPRAVVEPHTLEGRMRTIAILMLLNATLVHFVFAPNQRISIDTYVEMFRSHAADVPALVGDQGQDRLPARQSRLALGPPTSAGK